MEKYVTFYDLNKQIFVVTKREVREVEKMKKWYQINEGLIRKEQAFDNQEEAIKSLKSSNYICL